ncbi:hypothetical protein DL768_004437 [Monosporascus sp. mg162]|nr:hypothetical protein DL768_004437 [Monosporascus sp. mg162]
MASTENMRPSRSIDHQRSKSNVLRSFMHRRNNSDGATLPPAELYGTSNSNYKPATHQDIGFPYSSRPNALGEIQQNQLDNASRLPRKSSEQPRSPTKSAFASLRGKAVKDKNNTGKSSRQKDDASPTKPKKPKSTTNLVGLLSKPKSLKNLHKLASEEEMRSRKDKENRTPPSSLVTPQDNSRPPIYAQFASGALEKQTRPNSNDDVFGSRPSNSHDTGMVSASDRAVGYGIKERPKSYHTYYTSKQESGYHTPHDGSGGGSPSKSVRGLRVYTNGLVAKSSGLSQSPELVLDPKDIDKHLEAMLDRRNIPEHQRYKMRNLADTIKMEFIRQDWAESRGSVNHDSHGNRPASHDTGSSRTGANERGRDRDDGGKERKSRARSFTLSRGSGKKSDPNSPTKKQKGAGSIGRHFRTKSTDSVASGAGELPSSSGSGSAGIGSGILSKIKLQQGPLDYVNYLRKVQKPQVVEVGKLHKLRLLLRNETVAWTEEFIRHGGMEEIVGLLHRIMDVEWREEHEDALLHENLLCLKALCTTALALQYLHSIQATLFPALLHMLFDPDKKGPSEFTTRNIITSVLFTYIQSASPQERPARAKTVLGHLRDPEPKEEERPLGFVLEMRRDRPYRVWCKEVVSVTKEVFWIFLHHLNVVYLPREKEKELQQKQQQDSGENPQATDAATFETMGGISYMQTHFPQERPPVPAAPYVGGVEWDATNYLASHLDLLNAILACTPTRGERNALREALRVSGWERCMGGSLRLCKEKFYPGVHDALRTWVLAAADDAWSIRDVRYGPPPPESSRTASPAKKNNGLIAGANAKGKKKNDEAPPRIEIPKLDLGLPTPTIPALVGNGSTGRADGNWLS